MDRFVILVLLFLSITYHAEFAPHHSKASRGFKSFLCRLRHRKTIINLNGQPDGCVKRCQNNYDERYSLRWGHYCKQIVLPEGCADRFCISCISGYKKFYTYPFTSRCIESCPIGYTEIYRMCQQCLVNGCTNCHADKYSCKKCHAGKVLFQNAYSTKCLNECPITHEKVDSRCVMKNITTAAPQTTVPPTTVRVVTKADVPDGCKDKDCKTCINGYIKFVSPESKFETCVKECPQGYTHDGPICLACVDRRCASCKSSRVECDKCFSGYVMQLDASKKMKECVRSCPKSHEKNVWNNMTVCTPKPKPVCPVKNCKRCLRSGLQSLHAGCEQCEKGYNLFRGTFKDHCYTDCPPGYYSTKRPGTEILTCDKCEVPFCSQCSDTKSCKLCMAPMVLDGYGRCNTCPPKKHYSFDEKRCVSKKKTSNSVSKLIPDPNVVVEDTSSNANAEA